MKKNEKLEKMFKPPSRKPIFVSADTHDLFKKSAEDADRNYDPHLLRVVTFYEKYKSKDDTL